MKTLAQILLTIAMLGALIVMLAKPSMSIFTICVGIISIAPIAFIEIAKSK